MRKVFLYFFIILGLGLMAFRFLQNQLRGPWEIELTDESITQSAYLKVSSKEDTFIISKIDDAYWLSLRELSFPIEEDKVSMLTSTLSNLKTSRRVKSSRMKFDKTERVDFVYKDSIGQQEKFALLLYDSQVYYESALSRDLFRVKKGEEEMDLGQFASDLLLPMALVMPFEEEQLSYAMINADSVLQTLELDSSLLDIIMHGKTISANTRALHYDYEINMQLHGKDSSLLKILDVLVDSTSKKVYLQQQRPYRANFELDSISKNSFKHLVEF